MGCLQVWKSIQITWENVCGGDGERGRESRDLLVVEPESLEVFKGEMSQFSS